MGTRIDANPLANALEGQRIGADHGVQLSDWVAGNTNRPTIAGYIEVGGALYFFNDEAITGSPSDGDVYVRIDADGATASAVLTSVAPNWDYLKGGWYVGVNRYLPVVMRKTGVSFDNKREFWLRGNRVAVSSVDGDLAVDGELKIKIGAGLDGELSAKSITLSHSGFTTANFASPANNITGVAVDPATGNLISCDNGTNRIYVHDGISSTVTSSFATPSNRVSGVAVDPATGNLISCYRGTSSLAGVVRVHNGISATITDVFAPPSDVITDITIDPATGNLISCASSTTFPATIYVHQGITATIGASFAARDQEYNVSITGVAVDPATGNLISCTSTDGRIYIHDGISSISATSFLAPVRSVFGLAVNPDTNGLISCVLFGSRVHVHARQLVVEVV